MLTRKKFSADKEIIAEIKAYFEAKDKSCYKNGIEKLYGCYNRCITFESKIKLVFNKFFFMLAYELFRQIYIITMQCTKIKLENRKASISIS